MRREISIIIFFFGISLGECKDLYAWGNIKTHPALTEKAVGHGNSATKIDDYLKIQLGMDDGIETELEYHFLWSLKKRMAKADPKKTTRSVLDWIKAGSIIEDETLRQARSRHHFNAFIMSPP